MSSQGNATIFSLQSYITQLTCYINENNAKYTKNLETLKLFYDNQIQELQQKFTLTSDDSHLMKNDLLATRDLLNNKEKQLADLKTRFAQTVQENQTVREKLLNERHKIDFLYEEMESSKKQFRKELDRHQATVKQVENEKNDLILKLKEKQQELSRLTKDIQRLQDQVSERYSLPQKLKDIEIESAKNKTLLQTLTQTKRQLETKLDFQSNQLQRIAKENKRLQISFETKDTNAKRELNEALTKQRQLAQEKQKRLQSTNQKQLFEINELQNSLKALKRQNSELENKLNEYIQACKHLQHRISNHDHEKDRYIQQFQKLKREYEQVIKNLEEAIPKYQKKNWDFEQENRDLNVQLDGLRDLLNQMKAMNSLQPLKQQYRQIAELQLLAQKDYKAYREELVNKEAKTTGKVSDYGLGAFSPVKQPKDSDDLKWDKLLADIDNIQVA